MAMASALLREVMRDEAFDASAPWHDLKNLWPSLTAEERETLVVFGAEGQEGRVAEALRALGADPGGPAFQDAA